MDYDCAKKLDSSEDITRPNDVQRQRQRKKQVLTIVLVSLVLSVMTFATIRLIAVLNNDIRNPIHPNSGNPSSIFGDCGTTPTQARDQHCLFDAMSFSWLPSACYDEELVNQFLQLRNWTWSRDREGLDSVSSEEVLQGDITELFVTHEYHFFHCTYQWRKMHRGIERGVIDTYIADYGHTEHCEHMLAMNLAFDSVDTVIRMKFPKCQVVAGARGRRE